jgi:3-oxoacyl-[acyl-carrier protein] reductase
LSSQDAAAADLSGRVAVVTGAAAGLGRAEAIGLARAGATIVVNDIAGALDKSDVIDEIVTAGSKAVAVAGDISQRSTADELVETADGLGGLSIVVNNAGITRDRMLFNMSDDDWDTVIAVHLRGHFLLTRNAATSWPGELRCRQGRHHRADVVGRACAGALRGAGQCHRAPGADGDDGRRIRRRAGARRRSDRPVVARSRREPRAVPRLAGVGRG